MATPTASPSLKAREVARKVRGQPTSDGAGVRMTRVIGSQHLDSFDPFLLLDEFRSDDPNDYIAGFPDHPHRGFETVTYMLAGRMPGDEDLDVCDLEPQLYDIRANQRHRGFVVAVHQNVAFRSDDEEAGQLFRSREIEVVHDFVRGKGIVPSVRCGSL